MKVPEQELHEVRESATISGYTRSDWRWMLLAAATLIPLVLVRFLRLGADVPVVVAIVTGLAIIAAAFFLSWATEALETVVPQSVALALLALIEVAPEYTFEVILAYRGQTQLASASMTGANRLLLGLGWPMILFVAYVAARRRGQSFTEIRLGSGNVPEILFLGVATLYAFVIVLKRSFSLLDSLILILFYVLYIVLALRTKGRDDDEPKGAGEEDEEEDEEAEDVGVAARTKKLPAMQKGIAISSFMAIGAFILYTGAEPFIDAILQVGRTLHVSEFVLIQWVAPFLSEFPESLTAFIWTGMIVLAGRGLSNLLSSKLNQWTLLIAAIPIAYSVGRGHLAAVPLTAESTDEILLTAAQSVFGVVLLLTLRFGLKEAAALCGLFFLQFFIPIESIRLMIAWVYLVLALVFLFTHWRQVRLFREIRLLLPRGGKPARPGEEE